MNGFYQRVLPVLLLAITLFGCGTSNENSPNINPSSGKHPVKWAAAGGGSHPDTYFTTPSACYECHGTDLKGGISAVSCFSAERNGMSCHANGPGSHPTGWSAAVAHGLHAKALASGTDGFAKCQSCHGSDFSGGNAKKTCLNTVGCHGASVSAPHAAKPWLSRQGGSSHTTTDTSNATVCAACHAVGANSGRKPSTPAASGAAPGCFNNTLCHGVQSAGGASHKFPNPGSDHRSATPASCQGCHNITAASGTYPVAKGTAPICAGCHTRSLFVGCADCHGDSTGRPNGTGFPNKAGRHSKPGEHAVVCVVCHAGGGSGVTTHGNSNGTVKSVTDVILKFSVAGTVDSGTLVMSRNGATVTCTGICHFTNGKSQNHKSETW